MEHQHSISHEQKHEQAPANLQGNYFRLAFSATVHCLIGCGLGEVLGMVIGTWLSMTNISTMILAIILGAVLGLLFGFWTYTAVKNLPVHKSMADVSAIIYETCKAYLIQQGKFLITSELFIGSVMMAATLGVTVRFSFCAAFITKAPELFIGKGTHG